MEKTITKDSNSGANVRDLIQQNKRSFSASTVTEKIMPILLLIIALVSILTTVGIVITLLAETIEFFKKIPFVDFFTGTILKPLGDNAQFGILPLVTGTLLSTAIAMIVAIPIGLMTAIYLSEYASDQVRKFVKPILRITSWYPNNCIWILCPYICYSIITFFYT